MMVTKSKRWRILRPLPRYFILLHAKRARPEHLGANKRLAVDVDAGVGGTTSTARRRTASTARRRTATSRRARPRWRRSASVGGGSNFSLRGQRIGENNSSLEMARVDERALDNNSLAPHPHAVLCQETTSARILGQPRRQVRTARFRGTELMECGQVTRP